MVVIFSYDELMFEGLLLAKISAERQARVQRKTNLTRFISNYGSAPRVLCEIWETLQTTDLPDAKINVKRRQDIKHFLQAMNFLQVYAVEGVRAGMDNCERTVRDWGWYYGRRIQALKEAKVSLWLWILLSKCSLFALILSLL